MRINIIEKCINIIIVPEAAVSEPKVIHIGFEVAPDFDPISFYPAPVRTLLFSTCEVIIIGFSVFICIVC